MDLGDRFMGKGKDSVGWEACLFFILGLGAREKKANTSRRGKKSFQWRHLFVDLHMGRGPEGWMCLGPLYAIGKASGGFE